MFSNLCDLLVNFVRFGILLAIFKLFFLKFIDLPVEVTHCRNRHHSSLNGADCDYF